MDSGSPERRPNAMLTSADRKYLLGIADPAEYSDFKSWERQRRKQIKDRVRHSLVDFQLVATGLGADDLEDLFAVDDERMRDGIHDGAGDVISLLFAGLPQAVAAGAVQWGAQRAYQEAAALADEEYVEVEFDLSAEVSRREPLDAVEHRYREGEGVSLEELRILAVAGRVPRGEYFDQKERVEVQASSNEEASESD